MRGNKTDFFTTHDQALQNPQQLPVATYNAVHSEKAGQDHMLLGWKGTSSNPTTNPVQHNFSQEEAMKTMLEQLMKNQENCRSGEHQQGSTPPRIKICSAKSKEKKGQI